MLLCFNQELKPVNPGGVIPYCKIVTVTWYFWKESLCLPPLDYWSSDMPWKFIRNTVISFQNPPLLCLGIDMVCCEEYNGLMIIEANAVLIEYRFGWLNFKKKHGVDQALINSVFFISVHIHLSIGLVKSLALIFTLRLSKKYIRSYK